MTMARLASFPTSCWIPLRWQERPSDIIARCEELYEAGVDRIEFGTPHGLSSAAGISLLGNRVLPSLK